MTEPYPHPHRALPVATAGVALQDANAAVVLLHGRGATAESMLGFSTALGDENVHYVAPQAASLTWYPQSFLAPFSQNGAWLESALYAIDSVVRGLEQFVPADKIMLLGFSQGACLSLEYAARRGEPVGAVVALSGGLIGNGEIDGAAAPDDKLFDYAPTLNGMPVLLGCSDVDFHIPLVRVEQSASVLAKAGAMVDKRIYPGMGHTVNADEIEAAKTLLNRLA